MHKNLKYKSNSSTNALKPIKLFFQMDH